MDLPSDPPTEPSTPLDPHLTALLQAQVIPPASGASHNHVSGLVAGSQVHYGSLEAWCSYPAGGILKLNVGHRRRTRGHHGIEDGARQRRD